MIRANLKELKKLNNEQKQHEYFRTRITCEMNNNKQEYKSQKLQNGMEITGIGEKCLKIENNFYSWDDIEESAINDTEDEIMQNILAFIFEDYTPKTDNYTARRFTRSEALQNFDKIKQEIIENKQYYKTGRISGIGAKAVMVGFDLYDKEYIAWEQIKETLESMTIKDYVLHKEGSIMSEILTTFFEDDKEEETQVEKNLREKDVDYAEEKAYIYRHIISGDITVEMIRRIVRINHGTSDNYEEIINELLQFSFKYVKEVKFTNQDYDEEDTNKYAVKDNNSYAYIIKNKELSYDDETQIAKFEDIPDVEIKADGYIIEVTRKDKKPKRITSGHTEFYVGKKSRKTYAGRTRIPVAYEVSPEQQVQLLIKAGTVTKVDENELKQSLINIMIEESEICSVIREYISLEEIYERYDTSFMLQGLAKELYKNGRILGRALHEILLAVKAEPDVNSEKILDNIIWDDRNTQIATFYEDKYGFKGNEAGKRIINGFNEYTYVQNCEYTKITYSESYIDSFAVQDVYIQGDVEDIPLYFEYAQGKKIIEKTMKYGYLYEEGHIKVKF